MPEYRYLAARLTRCVTCDGDGVLPAKTRDAPPVQCPQCGGGGWNCPAQVLFAEALAPALADLTARVEKLEKSDKP